MKNPIKSIKSRIKYYKSPDRKYRSYWYSNPVNENSIMIESGRGETVNGNMFAVLKELRTAPEWKDFQVFFVVTDKSEKEAGYKMSFYGIDGVKLVKRMSDEYLRLLASCKYFFSDNTYPDIFCKKPDQLLINTWHGTPLKHMGRANIEGARGMGNVQRNYYMADYSLFPNEFTRDVFMDDYMIRYEYSGKLLMLDYPRNDALFDDDMRERVRVENELDGKSVYAYMPTWRGGDAKSVSAEDQIDIIEGYLKEIDGKLADDQILYVNLHPFVSDRMSYEGFRHIKAFPKEYETYDFLNATDALITDYSSVMFDYAGTGRKIILFTYDLEEYMADRGMYFDVRDLPFEKCSSTEALAKAISDTEGCDYDAFIDEYCRYRDGRKASCTKELLNIVIKGKEPEKFCHIERAEKDEEKLIHVIATGSLSDGISEELRKEIEKQLDNDRYVIVTFPGGMKQDYIPAFKELDKYENLEYCSLVGGIRIGDSPREFRRVMPGWRIDGYKTTRNVTRAHFGLIHRLMPVETYSLRENKDEILVSFKQKRISYLNHASVCGYDYEFEKTGDRYTLALSKDDLGKYKFKNPVGFIDDFGIEHRIIAGRRLDKLRRIIYSRMFKVDQGKATLACYLQEFKGGISLLVREANYSDKPSQRIIIGLAYMLAQLSKRKPVRPIMLYEKNSERYEESASVLYEKLMDRGYNNVYYVLNKDFPAWDTVPDRYRKNLLAKYSFRHYYRMFAAITVIATETITHLVDLRPRSPFLKYWNVNAGFNYVFLQHGVMYMISLDAESRAFFKMYQRPGYLNRIVVSSQLEADHFVKKGGFSAEELYICGLLKFDSAVRDEVHDRIVIMPTWRPWEAVLASEDFRETSYYKFIEKIYKAVPEELKDKVIVLPHPLIKKYAMKLYEEADSGDDGEVIRLMLPEISHEEVLRETDTLITDYSSISYDAFNRGANIIFDWEEKDDTVAQYGKTATLMLTEDLAFGKVCYDEKSLRAAIQSTYGKPHSEEEEKRFDKIVEYHDGHNTERFIEMIKKDGLL